MARKAPRLSEEERKLIQEDFRLLEQKLKVLRAEYNQYFIGSRKDPPVFTEATVRRLVRKYAGDGTLRGQERFTYYNLVARYTTMREFWSRRSKQIERGKQQQSPIQASPALEQARKRQRQRMEQKLERQYNLKIRDVREDTEHVRKLFVGYVRASRSIGADGGLKLKEFQNLVARQSASIRSRRDCDGVQFRITIEQGQIKLKAKPFQDDD